jgi:hypothetical protein
MFRVPVQLATQVPNRNAADTTLTEVLSTSSEYDVQRPEEPPVAAAFPEESHSTWAPSQFIKQ